MASPIAPTPEMLTLAQRCVWFRAPQDALANPTDFLAHVMTYGTYDDLRILRGQVSDADLREALDNAPPGVFDGRSWAYWNLILFGRREPPPLPVRKLS